MFLSSGGVFAGAVAPSPTAANMPEQDSKQAARGDSAWKRRRLCLPQDI